MAEGNRSTFRVGDRVRFGHFGAVNRNGHIVRVTPGAIYIEWTAPSSGKTRTLRVGLDVTERSNPSAFVRKNVRVQQEG